VIVYEGDPSSWPDAGAGSAVAIGVFDGVHRGHQAVFSALAAASDGLPLVAMTFSTHPDAVVRDLPAPPSLTTIERRLELFTEFGVEVAAMIDFTEDTMRLSPDEFVRCYLVDGLAARTVAVGNDFRFGHGASGTVDTLRILGRRYGFDIVATPIVTVYGTEVRSSTIRSAIASGGVELAARMLGRAFEIEGEVVPGDARGRTIGFPTANVSVPTGFVRPAGGVYAVRCTVDGSVYDGVSNVGTRPTFGGGPELIEVHLLDVDLDLYGRTVRVAFVDRIRSEQRFSSVEELVDQITSDIDRARLVLTG
jgi:riboflavin kinase / FMN adenylyltransferase